MIEIYHGDGKGKTTAAIGLAIRAAGCGIPVIFAQFLKNDRSGEIEVLKTIPQISVLHPDKFYGFVNKMTDEQKSETRKECLMLIKKITEILCEIKSKKASSCECGTDVDVIVVLDEVIHACNYGLLDEKEIFLLINDYSAGANESIINAEFVLTGRNPSKSFVDRADYISEIKKIKHPFDDGIPSRKGVEF